MYSRKFEGGSLPPNYGGVAYRAGEQKSPEEDPACRPRRPLYGREAEKAEPQPPEAAETIENERPKPRKGLSALARHTFTMEDIVLAGVILLLLTGDGKENDTDLILLLGFLLLAGL